MELKSKAMMVRGPAPLYLKLTVRTEKRQLHPPQSELKVTRECIAGLHPQSPRHCLWQHSARVSQTSRSSYPSHVTAVTT